MFPAIFIADGLSYRKVVLLQCTQDIYIPKSYRGF